MTNVEALKNVYVALGGSADDVADVANGFIKPSAYSSYYEVAQAGG